MADLPAASITLAGFFTFGNLKGWKALIKGDGTGVTIKVPLSRIEGYWTQSVDDTTIPAPSISYSGSTITYSTTPTNTKYHWLFVVGY